MNPVFPTDYLNVARAAREGSTRPLARSLKLTTTVHIYVIDPSGAIREVSAQRGDFTAKFAAALR